MFKRKVQGAYFAILSQALVAAFAILLVGQQKTTGGSNGLNYFRSFRFGLALNDPANRRLLFFITAGTLLVIVAVTRQIMYSAAGNCWWRCVIRRSGSASSATTRPTSR